MTGKKRDGTLVNVTKALLRHNLNGIWSKSMAKP